MPGMDGLALARAIRAESPLPLILLSSVGQLPGDDVGGLFIGQVPKPVKQRLLYEALHRALGVEIARTTTTAKMQRFDSGMAILSPLRILLAEDNPTNQKVGLMLLQNFGYRADLAVNGTQAVNAVRENAYDLVLMDVQMPEMDGTEAVRFIRAAPSIRHPYIVAVTAEAIEGDRERLLSAGYDDYISKPLRSERLKEMLQHVAGLKNR